jgi:hypothetical protein
MRGTKGGAKAGATHPDWRRGGSTGEAVKLRNLVNEMGRTARKLSEE